MNPKILVTYHKDTHIVNTGIIEPIQVGEGPNLAGCSKRDNSNSNIAKLNDRYCEMTAVYWAWKNLSEFSHIGFMHYRRFFDFNENRLHQDQWGLVNWPAFTTDFESRFGLNDAGVMAAIKGFDILLPKQWSVRMAGYRNLGDHYIQSPFHHASDLTLCRDTITEQCPEYLPYWRRVLASDRGWFGNTFVFQHHIFDAYCEWLFPLLAAVEKEIPFEQYCSQEKRVMGYLAERLLNVWIQNYLYKNPNTRVRELDRVFVTNTVAKVWDPIINVDQDKVISVVIASDDNYVPHLGALLASVFDNISDEAIVDLLILDGGITEDNQDMLRHIVPRNSSLHFIPMSDEFTSYFTHMHISRASYYRLVLDDMLASRSKVIYIDCDTIVLGDLSELWDIDMEDKPIAAVHDYVMEHFCASNVLSADVTGSLPAKRYLADYVGISLTSIENYFQAGLLIMNLNRIRQLGISKRMTETLLSRKFWFVDQDVLNKYFCGDHISLPAEWNFLNCTDDISHTLDSRRVKELEDARRRLKMIHYAGYEAKPWVNRSANFSKYYYYYLRRTPWYEEVLGLYDHPIASSQNPRLLSMRSLNLKPALKKIWRRLPWFVRRVCNPVVYSLRSRLTG